jgi:hypothetical protein
MPLNSRSSFSLMSERLFNRTSSINKIPVNDQPRLEQRKGVRDIYNYSLQYLKEFNKSKDATPKSLFHQNKGPSNNYLGSSAEGPCFPAVSLKECYSNNPAISPASPQNNAFFTKSEQSLTTVSNLLQPNTKIKGHEGGGGISEQKGGFWRKGDNELGQEDSEGKKYKIDESLEDLYPSVTLQIPTLKKKKPKMKKMIKMIKIKTMNKMIQNCLKIIQQLSNSEIS